MQDFDISKLTHAIRGQMVVLDSDVAKLYGMELSDLDRAVARAKDRFPSDFRFQLSRDEYNALMTKLGFSTPAAKAKTRQKLPFVYTEPGISMLSGILKSDVAVQTSIQIMRSFVKARHFVTENVRLLERIGAMELKQFDYQKSTDAKIAKLLDHIEKTSCKDPNEKIFFEGQIYDAYSFLIKMIKQVKREIVLVDGYVNINTLDILKHKPKNIAVTILTLPSSTLSKTEIKKFNDEYPTLNVHKTTSFHDRFMIFDRKKLYHIGASLKDAGEKTFAISKLEEAHETSILLSRIDNIITKANKAAEADKAKK